MEEMKRRRTTPPPPRNNPSSSAAAAAAVPATIPPSTTAASPISDLPLHLLHHIISFLPRETASQLCIVSKRFHSAWNSIPSLSFHLSPPAAANNYKHSFPFTRLYVSPEKGYRFLNYIYSTLSRRIPGVTVQKFQISAAALSAAAFEPAADVAEFADHAELADDADVVDDDDELGYHDRRLDAAIDYALSSGVRELDLALGNGRKPDRRYLFPHRILTAANNSVLTALRLSGFDLEPTRPVLLMIYPLLVDLFLSRTFGIERLEISCPRLKSLEIDSCVGLKSLTLDSQTSNLESFSFTGTRGSKPGGIADIDDDPYDLKISAACPSLTRISVSKVVVPSEWAADVAAKQRSLNSLRLTKFEPLDGDLDLYGRDNLQLVELEIWSVWVVGVRIRGRNLKALTVSYKGEQYSGEFDISRCGSLEELKLYQVGITGEWIKTNIPNFERLKSLELNCCRHHLKDVEVYHEGLERLVLDGCNELNKIEVVATNLTEFNYSSVSSNLVLIPQLVLGGSGRLVARLGLPPTAFMKDRFERSIEFLKSFGQCRKLTLVASFIESFTIDESLREGRTAPMYDLSNLEVETIVKREYWTCLKIDLDLVASLLWLAPHVNVLSLLLWDKRIKTLKLNHSAQGDTKSDEILLCCGTLWPVKCWRHSLREVTMDNFEPEDKLDLVEFFRDRATDLEAVYDNEGTILYARVN